VDLSTFTQPVPVILNLSTWTNKQQPLAEWLVAELNSKYRLPKKDGQRWLKERRILPLLDGLDEVKLENRAACVEKINQLVTDYGLQGLVVCSRIKDYTDLNVRLAFYRAIYIQPLLPEQVGEYLNRAGEELGSLRTVLQSDEALRSMAQSPLILSIMSLAYQNTSAAALSSPALSTNEARRQHLFDTYIARMFNRKVGARAYRDEETKQWISWLAGNMQEHNQTLFLLEGLEPSWLSTRRWKAFYFFVSRFVSGLMIGLIINWTTGSYTVKEGVILGFSAGIAIGVIDFLRFEWLRQRIQIRKSLTLQWKVTYVLVMCLISGLIFWLLSPGQVPPASLSLGLLFGLFFGLRGSRQSAENDIEIFEALSWSWHKAVTGGWTGAIVGLSLWLFFALIFDWKIFGPLFDRWLFGAIRILTEGLFSMLLFGLIGAIFNGLHPKIIETKSAPNQGIHLSIRNGIVVGLVVGLFAWLLSGPVFGGRGFEPLSIGLGYWLLVALWYGGFDVIQHYTLRLILLIQGHTPANYARFLDYSVDRIFLQKVGGGYRFIHRLLLEHFAEMGEAKRI
jgi:eukaryotic-like serine/threonine-protein kinase